VVDKPKKFVPALIGGAVLCVLSLIPFIGAGCCLWAIAGGAIAAYMYIKRSPVLRVTTGEGASVGALAGILGSLIFLVIYVPLFFAYQQKQFAEQFRQAGYQQADAKARDMILTLANFVNEQPLLFILIFWLFAAIFFTGLATLGGIIGVAMFEKRKGQPMPPMGPPPGAPDYGPGFAPPGPPPGGPMPPPGEPPYGGGDRPPY
jgi:hypothetical protein